MLYDTHYKEGKKVSFKKFDLTIKGLLFLPDNFDENKKYPAVVVVHPGGGVKEQCSSLYSWNLAKKGWEYAKKAINSGEYQLIILDELNICAAMNMIKVSEIKEVLLNKPENLEIVLTGRYAHPELIALAHLVTEMKPVKHYFDIGVMARQGIEY